MTKDVKEGKESDGRRLSPISFLLFLHIFFCVIHTQLRTRKFGGQGTGRRGDRKSVSAFASGRIDGCLRIRIRRSLCLLFDFNATLLFDATLIYKVFVIPSWKLSPAIVVWQLKLIITFSSLFLAPQWHNCRFLSPEELYEGSIKTHSRSKS